MFTVKTYLANSSIHGTGCMAGEFIPKGTVIWKFQENFDIRIDSFQFEQLPQIAKDFIIHFGYLNKNEGGYILCSDNARYTNHSEDANMEKFDEISSLAIKDIQEGEEITENYFYFDELSHLKLSRKN